MILDLSSLLWWREKVSGRLVVTNGAFDLLHVGHLNSLTNARALGDRLLVGLNSDESVRALKGPNRPIINQTERAEMLIRTGLVDAVCIFNDTRAAEFLRVAKPDVWCKGSDYSIDTLDRDEVAVVGRDKIVILPRLNGYSTTETIRSGQLG